MNPMARSICSYIVNDVSFLPFCFLSLLCVSPFSQSPPEDVILIQEQQQNRRFPAPASPSEAVAAAAAAEASSFSNISIYCRSPRSELPFA